MNSADTIYKNAALLEKTTLAALYKLNAVTDEYDTDNTSQIARSLEIILCQARMMQVYERFAKLSKEDFITLTSGTSGGMILAEYIVKSYESPGTIAAKFGMSLAELTELNNMTSDGFTAGTVISVYVPGKTMTITKDDIPVFGTHRGKGILGADLPKEPIILNGDLAVLDNDDTFTQGMDILTRTVKGDYPMLDFGITDYTGSDLPSDLVDNLLTTELMAQLGTDSRIARIDTFVIERQTGAVLPRITLTSIKGYADNG